MITAWGKCLNCMELFSLPPAELILPEFPTSPLGHEQESTHRASFSNELSQKLKGCLNPVFFWPMNGHLSTCMCGGGWVQADIVPDRDGSRLGAFGAVSGVTMLGFVVGPLLAAVLPEKYSFQVTRHSHEQRKSTPCFRFVSSSASHSEGMGLSSEC